MTVFCIHKPEFKSIVILLLGKMVIVYEKWWDTEKLEFYLLFGTYIPANDSETDLRI